jgi:hypothetical protein
LRNVAAIEALTAGLQKISAQLEASKPAPQVVNNPSSPPQQKQQHFAISRHISSRDGFSFHARFCVGGLSPIG